MIDFQSMSENGETSSGLLDGYRTWARTKAQCKHCGALAMNRPVLYGLASRFDEETWWVTETDCGCTWK